MERKCPLINTPHGAQLFTAFPALIACGCIIQRHAQLSQTWCQMWIPFAIPILISGNPGERKSANHSPGFLWCTLPMLLCLIVCLAINLTGSVIFPDGGWSSSKFLFHESFESWVIIYLQYLYTLDQMLFNVIINLGLAGWHNLRLQSDHEVTWLKYFTSLIQLHSVHTAVLLFRFFVSVYPSVPMGTYGSVQQSLTVCDCRPPIFMCSLFPTPLPSSLLHFYTDSSPLPGF